MEHIHVGMEHLRTTIARTINEIENQVRNILFRFIKFLVVLKFQFFNFISSDYDARCQGSIRRTDERIQSLFQPLRQGQFMLNVF